MCTQILNIYFHNTTVENVLFSPKNAYASVSILNIVSATVEDEIKYRGK